MLRKQFCLRSITRLCHTCQVPERSSRHQDPESFAGTAYQVFEEVIRKGVEKTDGKNPAAVELGRMGGLKGGKARAASLSAEERSEIAKKAAMARWSRDRS